MEDREIPVWLDGILATAAEKRSHLVCIRRTSDESGLETLVHTCGDDGCAFRPPVIPAEGLPALLTHLRQRTDGHNSPPSKFIWMGTFESEANGVKTRVKVKFSGTPRPQVDLTIDPYNADALAMTGSSASGSYCEGGCCDCC